MSNSIFICIARREVLQCSKHLLMTHSKVENNWVSFRRLCSILIRKKSLEWLCLNKKVCIELIAMIALIEQMYFKPKLLRK
jgi:hypothetical protein